MCIMLFSLAQFIVARTEVTNYYYLERNRVFVLRHIFRHSPFHNLRSTIKKINTAASLSFYYAPLTFYRTLKLRKCAFLLQSILVFYVCHLPAVFFSLLTTKTRYRSTGLEDFKLRENGRSHFSQYQCPEAATREIQSLEYLKRIEYECKTLATDLRTLKATWLRNCVHILTVLAKNHSFSMFCALASC